MNKRGMESWWLVAMIAALLILLVVIAILGAQKLTLFDLASKLIDLMRFR